MFCMKKKSEKPLVEIFTDGACSGNPGVGGYGIFLRSGERERELSGCEPVTTNNRMELTAVIKALEALKKPCKVTVVTDSNYVVQGMTTWIYQWLKNKWKNSQKQQVANKDLWEKLLHLSGFMTFSGCGSKGIMNMLRMNAVTSSHGCD